MNPYIGITDFTTFEQVARMLMVFRHHRPPNSRRMLQVGVMMSFKTLRGLETKWSKAFPPKETIAAIFSSGEAYNCLHYADYDHSSGFFASLALALEFGGHRMRAVQLDMVWPKPEEVARAIRSRPNSTEVILQVGGRAIAEANDDPAAVVARLRGYEGIIQRVLLDKSMGRGLGMDATGLLPFARAIKAELPGLGLGAAGGLGPRSLPLVAPLLAEFPDLSIDAQGQLRPSGNALDPVDWDMAQTYLVEALGLLK